MALGNMNATPQGVAVLIQKISDPDPDFRFMALNDLMNVLQTVRPDFLVHDYNTAARTVDSIIHALDDKNGEVQNLAVKCLGPLVDKVPQPIIAPMIEKLSSLKLENAVDNTVISLALRSVILALPRPVPGLLPSPPVKTAYDAIHRVLIPRLIGTAAPAATRHQAAKVPLPHVPTGILEIGNTVDTEAVDVLIDVVRCYGLLLQPCDAEAMQQVLMQLLESSSGTSVVRKRAVVAISMLAVYLLDEHLDILIERLTSGLSEPSNDSFTRRLYISLLGSMARSMPVRFGPHIATTAPFVLEALSKEELANHLEILSGGEDLGLEFNEVREAALISLEAFLAVCSQYMRPFTDAVISSALRYLGYDPNYAANDDEEDVDMDDNGGDDEDNEFDADDGFEDDDDDASWKVRRCAAKTLYTLISTRASGDLLETGVLYKQAAPSLIKRVDEREENVRLEVISALALLVRKTGEGMHVANSLLDESELSVAIPQVPLSRKRRRQSSAGVATTVSQSMAGSGLTSPVLEKVPPTGPRADLAQLTPSLVKAAIKQLKSRSVPTKQSVVNLLDDLVLVQSGGLSVFLADLIEPVLEAADSSAHGSTGISLAGPSGYSSATPGTLRMATMRLISNISKTHSSTVLQPYLPKLVAGVTAAVHDKFYKISSEAIRTAEELVKAITPPRSRSAGSKHASDLTVLYKVIAERCSAIDADAEVRWKAIHALGVLVSRTSEQGCTLLRQDQRHLALEVLRERLKNETTRLAAVRAIDNVAALASGPGQLEEAWTRDVALELSAQLRKANRSLRSSSVNALKHLILSSASKGHLNEKTANGIVSALMPAIISSDTHLLGPALLILANLAPEHPTIVVSNDMIAALCQLLKSPFASIVLDQLLELVVKIGESGASQPLMNGLLKEVSISGDPSVVGKVIGTLLVTGDTSNAFSIDSFISELESSAKAGDDARVSLALAVLGEVGMRLGPISPLKPDVFLAQFHQEPDKVSLAASIALGRAGSGNVAQFLPIILKKMSARGNTQYLLIQSIKEILQDVTVQSADLREHAVPIWDHLLEASEASDNRIVCAECVGRLVTIDPGPFMPRMQALLKHKSTEIRAMAVQAIRYTLPETEEAFDAVLKATLVDMLLTVLQDSDAEIRRLAMTTLNSAARNKPDLILPQLGALMPYVIAESNIKPELIKEVVLGPFKHIMDDGLEVRKSAYETLYALMETAFTRMNNVDFFDRIIAGLNDDNDIRQLCNLMITKLIVIDPDETARRLDSIADAYRRVLSVKLKDNAVKQDVEKQEEANKSVLRVTLLLGDKMKAMSGSAGAVTTNTGALGAWSSYWEWVNKEFERQLEHMREDTHKLRDLAA